MPEREDLGADAAGADLEEADGAQPGREMVRQDGAAGVDEEDALAEFEPFHVCIAANEDVDRRAAQRRGDDMGDRPRFGAQFMSHPDPEPIDIDELARRHPRVPEQVVVALGDKDGRELRAPVEDGGSSNVASMKDEVHATECVGDLRAQLIEAAHERREVCVADQAYPHPPNATMQRVQAQDLQTGSGQAGDTPAVEEAKSVDSARFREWLAAAAPGSGARRVVRASRRRILVSKFEEGFFERLETALDAVPELFDRDAVANAFERRASSAPGRSEAWRLAMEDLLRAAEADGRIDARQRAEVMAGVDSVAALLEGVTWTDPGPLVPWAPGPAERAALAEVRARLEPDGRLFTREYGAFEGTPVVNFCPGSRHARRFFEMAAILLGFA